jgi:hypothetical protein
VIVIIGLIVAGVVGGQTLARQAQLRSIISEVDGYKVAVRTFQLQYDSYPGDLSNAKSYWSSCTDVSGNNCNGNGNKVVLNTENLRFWEHMVLADLIDGAYTGRYVNTNEYKSGVNLPASKFSGGGFMFRQHNTYGISGQGFQFGGYASNDTRATGLINASEAKGIDDKLDDGLAASGYVITNDAVGETDCIDGSNLYNLSHAGNACRVWFWVEYTK